MREPDIDTLLFFDACPKALPLYLRLEEAICDAFTSAGRRVQKTQITFFDRHVFACASLARVKRKAELPNPYLVVTLGLPGPLDSARVAARSEPYPGRWTTHIVVGSVDEIDGELLAWIAQAYAFSMSK